MKIKGLPINFNLLLNRLKLEYQIARALFLEVLPGRLNLTKRQLLFGAGAVYLILSLFLNLGMTTAFKSRLNPLISPIGSLHPINVNKSNKEVFGFAPFWTFDKMGAVDFSTLTTLSYFGVEVGASGDLDRSDQGYITFKSRKATELFKKAHANGTRVVLTLTQMNNWPIEALLDNPDAQANVIDQAVGEVNARGIDGINVDLEYGGDPGQEYRDKFTAFVEDLTDQMHKTNPNSKVTVSVYAGSVRDPKIYDIKSLAKVSDGIFMMAYDFANVSADEVIPTAPLYGYEQGQYWYDVSTAVEDFLTQMPANKLILGMPWYGYNYPVAQPEVKAVVSSYWGGGAHSQTYGSSEENIKPNAPNVADYKEGWDSLGQVGWKAYQRADTGAWRMVFEENPKSVGVKVDFAKSKDLAGVGIWALGFDEGKGEMWSVLKNKLGEKLSDASLTKKAIKAEVNYD